MKTIQKVLMIIAMALTMSLPQMKADFFIPTDVPSVIPQSTGIVDVIQERSRLIVVTTGTDNILLKLISPTGVEVYKTIVTVGITKTVIHTEHQEAGIYQLIGTSQSQQQRFEIRIE